MAGPCATGSRHHDFHASQRGPPYIGGRYGGQVTGAMMLLPHAGSLGPSVWFRGLHDLRHGYLNGEFETSVIEFDLWFMVQRRCNQAAPETLIVRSLDAGAIALSPREHKPRLLALAKVPADHDPSIGD